jgi:hypothetical protein
VVATGVGNLAHFGEALPEAEDRWGKQLLLKLGLVAAFLLFSVVRTLAVTNAASGPIEAAPKHQRTLGALYGVTAAGIGSIVGVAVALAHF